MYNVTTNMYKIIVVPKKSVELSICDIIYAGIVMPVDLLLFRLDCIPAVASVEMIHEQRGGRTESAGRTATATRPEPGVATSPTHTYWWTWSPPWFLPLFSNAKSVNDQCRSTSHSQTILHETRPTAEYVLNTLDACAQAQEYRIHTHPKKDQRRR